ncbi:hypothetical protein ENUP19_0089G0021 [Entamoeba nuttalli]|uniref:Sec 13 protein, putative n=2 Tax=Entamoeba nuttalli TaxID=412467 RepID=K2HN98_ENTNP|nr:sec 13 protein, putative [Entamoeba nuttalli P19]EKE37325.1 sec 13 protein, putative [Entamoeba nuttalli P19]|eukprot:XP_008860333.1 sec 13 protein, putative [Entamoeba nuttalli P19]
MEFDFYGTKVACVLDDKSIVIFDTTQPEPKIISTLVGHTAAIWQVKWSHPRFGPVLASCSYDKQVLIWRETSNNNYAIVYSHKFHTKSVNSICFFPESEGLKLACGSSDGQISIIEYVESTKSWKTTSFNAHPAGVNTLTVIQNHMKVNIVSGGCDSIVKFHEYIDGEWKCVNQLKDHKDWIRDVSVTSSNGKLLLATCAQDHMVFIYEVNGTTIKLIDHLPEFKESCWRVAFNGDVLAVSLSNNEVEMWKNNDGKWVKEE